MPKATITHIITQIWWQHAWKNVAVYYGESPVNSKRFLGNLLQSKKNPTIWLSIPLNYLTCFPISREMATPGEPTNDQTNPTVGMCIYPFLGWLLTAKFVWDNSCVARCGISPFPVETVSVWCLWSPGAPRSDIDNPWCYPGKRCETNEFYHCCYWLCLKRWAQMRTTTFQNLAIAVQQQHALCLKRGAIFRKYGFGARQQEWAHVSQASWHQGSVLMFHKWKCVQRL